MLNDITLGQYVPGNTIIHRLDPRIKLILLFCFIIIAFAAKTIVLYVVLFSYILIVSVTGKIKSSFLIKSVKPLLYVIVFTFIMNILLVHTGKELLTLGFVRITTGGLIYALRLTARLLLLVFSTSILTFTTSPLLLTDAMERIMSPLKKIGFPSHELAMMMTIALRFIPTLMEETDRIMKAQISRGAELDSGNLFKKVKALVPIMVPLFVSAFRRADELAIAMEARCYHGGEGRTKYRVLKLKKADYYATLSGIALIICIVIEKILV